MKKKKISYEEAVEELEEIVNRLEKDESSLSDSVELFKKGVDLYKYCNSLLSKAEGEVKILLDDSDESLIELDFFEEADGEEF